MRPQGIVIHHSLTKDSQTVSWDAIRRYHVETMGWSAIGYHYGLEDVDGKLMVMQGRPIDKPGAHTAGFNQSIGICLVGNWDDEEPDDARIEALADLTVDVLQLFPHLTPANVHPHAKFAAKSCPGRLFPWTRYMMLVWERWRDV